jgi:hypothetical protein
LLSRSARAVLCVVVPLPSGPSKTMKRPDIRSSVYRLPATIHRENRPMSPDAAVQHRPDTRTVRLFPAFSRWYWLEHPVTMARTYLRYAGAFRESFSIIFMLRTLFAPWKSIKDSYPTKGFNLQAILETLFLNITTRSIGAVIRLSAIISGLVIQIFLLGGFLAYLLLWMVFPFVLLCLIPYLIVMSFL